jgi:hypothetical protein
MKGNEMSDRCFKEFVRVFSLLLVCAMLALSSATVAKARFITPDTWDPILAGVDFNRYAYGANDPVNRSDPNGHNFMDWYMEPNDVIRNAINTKNVQIHEQLAKQFEDDGQTEIADEHRRIADYFRERVGKSKLALAGQAALSVAGSAGVKAPGAAKQGWNHLASLGNPLRGGVGYNSFDALKSALGSAGPGRVWHHIVEQCQGKCTRSTFPSKMINNTKNVVAVPKEVNQRIADFYSRTVPGTKMTLRDWLSKKSFKEQHEYGKKLLDKAMKEHEKIDGKP